MEAKLLAVVVIAFGQFIYAIGIVVSVLLFMEKREEIAKGKATEAKVSRRRDTIFLSLISCGSLITAAGIKFF